MKCKGASDGRAHDHHTLQVMRQQAIKAVRNGQTVQSVADAFGVNIRSVFRWLAGFANGGQNALLGQYYDRETNLHFNHCRDYDPRVGRYVQSDPIGLEGGINTYAYVNGNPAAYFDPDGLVGIAGNGSVTVDSFPGGPAGGREYEPRRNGLGPCEAQGFDTTGRQCRENEAVRSGRAAQHSEATGAGEVILSPPGLPLHPG